MTATLTTTLTTTLAPPRTEPGLYPPTVEPGSYPLPLYKFLLRFVANLLRQVRFEWDGRHAPEPLSRVTLRPRGGMPLRIFPLGEAGEG
jgi:hypothetical protein